MQSNTEKVIPATLIVGDGIGQEIVEATVMVLDAMHAPFAWEAHKAGMSGVEAFGDPLPQITLDSIRHDFALPAHR
jgi:isocitrate dehydrogenase (NAD+)